MHRILDKLKTEPVRVRLYALIALASGYLKSKGLVDVTDVDFILAVTVLILGVESIRGKVMPMAYVPKHQE